MAKNDEEKVADFSDVMANESLDQTASISNDVGWGVFGVCQPTVLPDVCTKPYRNAAFGMQLALRAESI